MKKLISAAFFMFLLASPSSFADKKCAPCGRWIGLISQIQKAKTTKQKVKLTDNAIKNIHTYKWNKRYAALEIPLIARYLKIADPYDDQSLLANHFFHVYKDHSKEFEKHLPAKYKKDFLAKMDEISNSFGGSDN